MVPDAFFEWLITWSEYFASWASGLLPSWDITLAATIPEAVGQWFGFADLFFNVPFTVAAIVFCWAMRVALVPVKLALKVRHVVAP